MLPNRATHHRYDEFLTRVYIKSNAQRGNVFEIEGIKNFEGNLKLEEKNFER